MVDVTTLIFVGYVLFAVTLIYTLLFGKIHRFLTSGLWVLVGNIGPKICGRGMYRKFSAVGDWMWNKPNPLMQIFYLILTVGGSSLMMWSGFEYIPGPFLHSFHKITFPLWVAFNTGFFIFTSKSNPGRITKDTWADFNAIFPLDHIIYGPAKCRTCLHDKVARSKHCSICQHDTARYDHHCPWVYNCVGLLNLRWFLLFLFFTGLLINYVTYLSTMILMGIIESNNLWYYADPRGRLQETPYSYIFQYLVYSAVAVVGLWMFTIFIGAVVYGFLGYHLWLISRGTTTNETFKWSDFDSEQKQLRRLQQKRSKNSSISADDFEDALADMPLVKPKVIKNIYNRGIIQNFREVFFPLDPANRHPMPPPSPKMTPRGTRTADAAPPASAKTTEKPRESKKHR